MNQLIMSEELARYQSIVRGAHLQERLLEVEGVGMRATDRVSVWFNNMDVDQLFFLGSMPAVTYEGSGQAPYLT
jgi:hypothetical protein